MTAIAGTPSTYQGNDKLLYGIILGVITFWLFAQTTLNIAPAMQKDLGLDASMMNIAVAITALYLGPLHRRHRRPRRPHRPRRTVQIGFYLSIIGSLLIAIAPTGSMATAFLLVGRALQGVSAACIMPASLALVKTYWDGPARQRAVSLWSIGSWGGSGVCSLFGGLVADNIGWRYIFFASIVVAHHRPADDQGHAGKQGRDQGRLQVRPRRRADLHDRHGGPADRRHPGQQDGLGPAR